MKNILVLGSSGQIGSELVPALRKRYGNDHVVASDIQYPLKTDWADEGPSCKIDATQADQIAEVIKKYNIDTIYNLVAILSATAEAKPLLGWNIGMGVLMNCLELSREFKTALFTPSSIGAFGPETPNDKTPQDTIQRPKTIYGITKVAGELLGDYYHKRFGVDTRSVRYPGLISNVALPGGGTTDYAVEIYYAAIKDGHFTCPIKSDTYMDMLYMPDAIEAAINLMEIDSDRLIHRNSFNVTGMSVSPEIIANEIKKHIPDFTISYDIDPLKQSIAESWPNSLDDSVARKEWGWNPKYDLESMTKDMIQVLTKKLK